MVLHVVLGWAGHTSKEYYESVSELIPNWSTSEDLNQSKIDYASSDQFLQ
jgi:hypothetical protein